MIQKTYREKVKIKWFLRYVWLYEISFIWNQISKTNLFKMISIFYKDSRIFGGAFPCFLQVPLFLMIFKKKYAVGRAKTPHVFVVFGINKKPTMPGSDKLLLLLCYLFLIKGQLPIIGGLFCVCVKFPFFLSEQFLFFYKEISE